MTSKVKYHKSEFDSMIVLHHKRTETKFYQEGGRIIVLRLNDQTGIYHSFADFSTTELQITGTYLTQAQLITAAQTWLRGNL